MKSILITFSLLFICNMTYSQNENPIDTKSDTTAVLQYNKTYSGFVYYGRKKGEKVKYFIQRINADMKSRKKRYGMYAVQFENVDSTDGYPAPGVLVLFNSQKFFVKEAKLQQKSKGN